MQRILRGIVFPVAAFALVSFAYAAQQQRDESAAVQNRDWRVMWDIAKDYQKAGNTAVANIKFSEAFQYALFWAVYEPTNRFSGGRRDDGMKGMRAMRMEGPPGPDAGMGPLFDRFAALDLERPPIVFSGGPNNYGLWRDQDGAVYKVKQNGSAVAGGRPPGTNPLPGIPIRELDGTGFNGTTIQVSISEPLTGVVYRGQMTFDGNNLSGTLRADGNRRGPLQFTLRRMWAG